MDGEINNLVKLWLSILASLFYCYFLASKIPKGKFRLISLLPIFILFTALPLYLSYVFPIGLIALLFSWLEIPISQKPRYTSNSSKKHPKLPLNWPTKVLLFAILVSAHDYKQTLHPKIVLLLYSCMVYLLIDIIFGIFNGLVHATSGLELEPPSDEPYLSTSLQDFWGRRWNLMVTYLLRHTVYKPARSFFDNMLGSMWAPLAAVLAAFIVSGLMHELVFYYVTRVSPTWEVTWYFFGVKRVFSSKAQLHWAVSTPLTVGFVVATAMWLFFPPVLRTGAVEKAIEECKVLLDFAKVLWKVNSFW
ncbi:hypothetical protein V6Z11_1Z099300 [Gossypium hirsutum]